MDLRTKTKAELREMAKELQIEGCEEMNKVTLLAAVTEKLGIENVEEPTEEPAIEVQSKPKAKATSQPVKTKPKELSQNARNWKAYLDRYKITPEKFLERFPNHPYKQYIQELIN